VALCAGRCGRWWRVRTLRAGLRSAAGRRRRSVRTLRAGLRRRSAGRRRRRVRTLRTGLRCRRCVRALRRWCVGTGRRCVAGRGGRGRRGGGWCVRTGGGRWRVVRRLRGSSAHGRHGTGLAVAARRRQRAALRRGRRCRRGRSGCARSRRFGIRGLRESEQRSLCRLLRLGWLTSVRCHGSHRTRHRACGPRIDPQFCRRGSGSGALRSHAAASTKPARKPIQRPPSSDSRHAGGAA
jgi:hypothetical protein